MNRIFLLMISTVLFISCKTGNTLFGRKNFHDEYGRRLTNAGLNQSALGRNWFGVAESALTKPLSITLPYKEKGYFAADHPRSVGLLFPVKRGQKILITLGKNPPTNFALYVDLWQSSGQRPSLLFSFDTAQRTLEYEVEKDANLVLRLQPELLQSGDYELSVTVGPSLKFPVAGKAARVGSFWGDSRDAGARNHEGIDIFANRRTPAIAGASGRITSVTENNLGGKVVFLRPDKKDYSLYYAHLDEQLVETGQNIREGDTIGLVGNTGNAMNTSPHLHFGIYSSGGAIDPFPFVDPQIKQPQNVSMSVQKMHTSFRLNRTLEIISSDGIKTAYPIHSVVFPVAATSKEMNIELPNGQIASIPITAAVPATSQVKQVKTRSTVFVLDRPFGGAPKKQEVDSGSSVFVYGYFNDYAFVKTEKEIMGWVLVSRLTGP